MLKRYHDILYIDNYYFKYPAVVDEVFILMFMLKFHKKYIRSYGCHHFIMVLLKCLFLIEVKQCKSSIG